MLASEQRRLLEQLQTKSAVLVQQVPETSILHF
jgi:hypothetical protein